MRDRVLPVPTSSQSDTTPFFEAARNGHMKVMELLVEKKADVNAKAPVRSTAVPFPVLLEFPTLRVVQGDISALMLAAERGDAKVVKFLLQHGAEVNDLAENVRTAGPLCIHLLCRMFWFPVQNGWSAMMFAAYGGHRNLIESLTNKKTKINQPDLVRVR